MSKWVIKIATTEELWPALDDGWEPYHVGWDHGNDVMIHYLKKQKVKTNE